MLKKFQFFSNFFVEKWQNFARKKNTDHDVICRACTGTEAESTLSAWVSAECKQL
jgi:hypothetical protein